MGAEHISADVDVLIIGAGPAGAIAAALLHNKGYRIRVLEREQFPRFSIGESLLPQCMDYIEEAGMLPALQAAGFQFKNGAAFKFRGQYVDFDFNQKFSPGHGTTFQVERGRFDKLLADEASRMGADIRFRHTITAVDFGGDVALVNYTDDNNTEPGQGVAGQVTARFVLDASGFGRVLPRLLRLERPSNFPVRMAAFTHVDDHISDPAHDRHKILVTVHPEHRDVWFWLIPFSDGRCSLGVVAEKSFLERYGDDPKTILQSLVAEDEGLSTLLNTAEYNYPARKIVGYSANVTSLYGDKFALLGNAGEFLDPVFSSGVTIAMRSASMASALLDKQLQGESVDWENDYSVALRKGVDTFRTFVEAWYDTRFQDIIFYPRQQPEVKAMVCSILAGYAWDENNPYVAEPARRMRTLAEICKRA